MAPRTIPKLQYLAGVELKNNYKLTIQDFIKLNVPQDIYYPVFGNIYLQKWRDMPVRFIPFIGKHATIVKRYKTWMTVRLWDEISHNLKWPRDNYQNIIQWKIPKNFKWIPYSSNSKISETLQAFGCANKEINILNL